MTSRYAVVFWNDNAGVRERAKVFFKYWYQAQSFADSLSFGRFITFEM